MPVSSVRGTRSRLCFGSSHMANRDAPRHLRGLRRPLAGISPAEDRWMWVYGVQGRSMSPTLNPQDRSSREGLSLRSQQSVMASRRQSPSESVDDSCLVSHTAHQGGLASSFRIPRSKDCRLGCPCLHMMPHKRGAANRRRHRAPSCLACSHLSVADSLNASPDSRRD